MQLLDILGITVEIYTHVMLSQLSMSYIHVHICGKGFCGQTTSSELM